MKGLPQASRKSVPTSTIDRESTGCGAGGDGAALGAADWLCLAAAPTFAAMALLTGVQSSGPPDIFCSAMHGASPLGGIGACSDAELAEHIRQQIAASRLHGEGYRKLWARLRFAGGAQVKVQSYSKINNMGRHPKDRHCHRCGEPFAAGAMLYTEAVQRYRNRIRRSRFATVDTIGNAAAILNDW
jgi:hypothetical protein